MTDCHYSFHLRFGYGFSHIYNNSSSKLCKVKRQPSDQMLLVLPSLLLLLLLLLQHLQLIIVMLTLQCAMLSNLSKFLTVIYFKYMTAWLPQWLLTLCIYGFLLLLLLLLLFVEEKSQRMREKTMNERKKCK